MKLSEAIQLGALLGPQGFVFGPRGYVPGDCALAAAGRAIGQSCMRQDPAHAIWPWLAQHVECPVCRKVSGAHYAVWHLNDDHLWTRERIAEWVASIEPQETTSAESVRQPEAVEAEAL